MFDRVGVDVAAPGGPRCPAGLYVGEFPDAEIGELVMAAASSAWPYPRTER
jgi:hypothetical protein